jgi:hypothetical protein
VAAVVLGLGLVVGIRLAARHPRDVGFLDWRLNRWRVAASQSADPQHQRDEDACATVFGSGSHRQSIALGADAGSMIRGHAIPNAAHKPTIFQ